MASDNKNFAELHLKIITNIRESLLDVTYRDEMTDAEVEELVQQMTNISEYVVELLGIEVQRENEDGSISALLRLKAD
jgi:Asp-tRNA(Asn)/Glu-tRNA(Gln) amidotransferase C subunit